FFCIILCSPRSTLFPYTTLFRSMMVNYVTILGIFASIIITVFGGINLTNATVKLLESEHDLPMMVFVISFLMIGFISILIILIRSEEHTSELQSRENLVCRLLLE